MRKSDITWHSTGNFGGHRTPAVNVKVQNGRHELPWPDFPGLTWEWIDSNVSEVEQTSAWEEACAVGWEAADELAREIFGDSAKCYGTGHSGGWAYVAFVSNGRTRTFDSDYRDGVEHWDAIALARWARFERGCKVLASDTPYQYLFRVYVDFYEPAMEQAEKQAKAACMVHP